MDNTLLAAALGYAERGLFIIPCHDVLSSGKCSCCGVRPANICPNPGKHPRIMDQYHKSSTDPAVIRGWWEMWPRSNIGIDCGRSGLLVVDPDVHDGLPGLETWARLVEKFELDTRTPTVRTGTGGQHVWYRQPAGLELRNGDLGPGVHTRGHGGLVIAPPSANAGGPYTWLDGYSLDDLPIVQLPIDLVRLLAKPARAAVKPSNGHTPEPGGDYVQTALDAVRTAPVGTRNNTLFQAAARLGNYAGAGALDESEAAAQLAEAAEAAGLEQHEIEKTIESGLNKGKLEPRQPPPPEPEWPADVPEPGPVGNSENSEIMPSSGSDKPATVITAKLLSANTILHTAWPEPVVIVPDILTAGLGILAGAAKLGKSWLGLQMVQAVASGGQVLGRKVEAGPTLYLALEDPPRRLQERMIKQHWPDNLPADFLTLGDFAQAVGDMLNGGALRLGLMIEQRGYRLVVIDTFSRSIRGDQKDVAEMTRALTPLQELAHKANCAVLMIDHHRKVGAGNTPDVIADILGSTGKGAMADTVLGLYRERGKATAKLTVTGRDVIEQTLALKMDWELGCWQWEGDADALDMTERRKEIIDALRTLGRAKVREIANAIGQDRSNTYRRLVDLLATHKIKKDGEYYVLP